MIFTGERVIPDQMNGDILTLQEHLTRYVFALNFCHQKKVLDVACGTGYGMEILSMVAKQIQGGDMSAEALDYARKNYANHFKPSFYFQCDFENTDFVPSKMTSRFDIITSFETIEHLSNPDFFLMNVRKALVDNGLFIFSIPNSNPSKFHKKVYDFFGAVELIERNFGKVEWHGQDNVTIGEISKNSQFFLGIARK